MATTTKKATRRTTRKKERPRIAPSIQHLSVPIEELKKLRNNPRKGNKAAIKRVLEEFGQRYPIVVRKGTVLAGNHRLECAIELGWTELAVADADDLTAKEAKAFALADNRTGDLADYDEELLAQMLGDLDAHLQLVAGSTEADVRALLGDPKIEGDPDELPAESGEPPITERGDIVLDPFLGSGTTVIAAHATSRTCYGMELEERYVDVICARYQKIAGVQPVLERTGKAHDFEAP